MPCVVVGTVAPVLIDVVVALVLELVACCVVVVVVAEVVVAACVEVVDTGPPAEHTIGQLEIEA